VKFTVVVLLQERIAEAPIIPLLLLLATILFEVQNASCIPSFRDACHRTNLTLQNRIQKSCNYRELNLQEVILSYDILKVV
jgi:hypothetical protein